MTEKGRLLPYKEETRWVPLPVSHSDSGTGRTGGLVAVAGIAPTSRGAGGVACEHGGDGLPFAGRTPTARYTYRSRDELIRPHCRPGEQRNAARVGDYAAERHRLRLLFAAEVSDVFPGAVPPLAEDAARTG